MSEQITFDIIRQEYLQKLKDESVQLQKYIENAEKTLQITTLNGAEQWIIDKNREKIEKMVRKQSEIQESIDNVDSPETILKLQERVEFRKEQHTKGVEAKKKKVIRSVKDKKAKKQALGKIFSKENKQRRDDRYLKKNMDYEWRRLGMIEASLPDYIKKNLDNMPNNKGYIWRGVKYYGRKIHDPAEPTILFERYHGTMYIHEYTDKTYKKYKKENKNTQKVLVKEEKRTPKFPKFVVPTREQQKENKHHKPRSPGKNKTPKKKTSWNKDNKRKKWGKK